MASFVLVRHKVRDFAEWKRGYDAQLPKLNEAGLTESIFFATLATRMKSFFCLRQRMLAARRLSPSPKLCERQGRGGIVDEPDIYFLNE